MNIAIVEASHWHAPMYLEALAAMDVNVVAVTDQNEAVASRTAVRFGCQAFTDYAAMLRAIRPDFVFAFGRHRDMPAIAETLIREHIPFAMEKPMGLSALEVESIRRLAERNKAYIAVPLVLRFSPIWAAIEELRAEGRFGELTNAYFRFIAGPPNRYLKVDCAWLLDPAISGGGCTINLGVHFIDLSLSLLAPHKPYQVYAVPSRIKYAGEVEDFSTVVMKTKQGAVCTVETGYAYPSDAAHPRHIEYCITTTEGYLEIREGEFVWAGHDGARLERKIVTDNDHFYPMFIKKTLEDFAGNRRPAASVGEMVETMKVIDAVYRSGRERQAVRL